MSKVDLTAAESHFAFGRNWAAYAEKITPAEIDQAVLGLSRLTGGTRLDGKRFLDIGSGSGLHSLAALRLGAREVLAVDIDEDSMATSRAVLTRHASHGTWRAERCSVFDLDSNALGKFDIVYSWGVLHHTGDMIRAIEHAADMCAVNGQFVFALYRRIWMDWFWRVEKKWYAHAGPEAQTRARIVHEKLFQLALLLTGRRLDEYVAAYHGKRGMDFGHDVHDWLGGWPYESTSASEVDGLMRGLGFRLVRRFAQDGKILGRDPGLLGSGCDEYVYQCCRDP